MNRKRFLKHPRLARLSTGLPDRPEMPVMSDRPVADCVVAPTETDGPYPLYTSRGSAITRVDITDGKTGIPLLLNITIVNVNANCAPVANARVDVLHGDKDGYYSGYSNSGYPGTQNNTTQVFCRGIQYTNTVSLDTNGAVKKLIYQGGSLQFAAGTRLTMSQ